MCSTNSRQTAAEIILAWKTAGDFPQLALNRVSHDKAFVTEVVMGVVRWDRALSFFLDPWMSRRPKPATEAVLKVGLFQILMMSNVEGYAAVNETVEAAKTLAGLSDAGFVNALLRKAINKKSSLLDSLAGQPLGTRESHPEILVNRWISRWGKDYTTGLCSRNNQRPPMVLRVNALKTSPEKYLEACTSAGIKARAFSSALPAYLLLDQSVYPASLPGFQEGWFFIQDPSAHSCVDLLQPLPGETVLDACASPGGKMLLIHEAMKGKGVILAVDKHANRLQQLHDNVQRMETGITRVEQASADDAKDLQRIMRNHNVDLFDRILIDVPCTNTGVIRRRPDARWRFSEQRLKRLTAIQWSILKATSGCLKVGGVLVYNTCSLEPEENELMVERWIKEHPSWTLIKEIKTDPLEADTDGGYSACLQHA